MAVDVSDEGRIADRFRVPRHDTLHRREPKVFGPRELYGLLRRRSRLIGVLTATGTLLAALAASVMPETFTASSMIVLQADDPNLLEVASPQQPREQLSNTRMDTEKDLLKSRVFLGRVTDELNLIADPRFNTYLRRSERAAADPEAANGLGAFLVAAVDRAVGLLFARDDEARAPLPSSDLQRDRAISVFRSKLSIVRNGESLAMTIAVSAHDPELAASLANAVTRLYVAWSSDQNREDTRTAVNFLRQQASELALRIATLEEEIADYGSRESVSIDPRDDLLRATMQQANEQLSVARGELTQAQSRLNQVRSRNADASAIGNDPLLASTFLTTLRSDEAVALRERAQFARNLGDNHPSIREGDAKIASVRRMISQEEQRIFGNLENDVRVAQNRVAQIEQDLAMSNEKLRRRGHAEIRLRELNRDLLAEQKLYDVVLDKLGKLDPYADVAEPGARVISLAEVPSRPSSPSLPMLAAGGFTGSLILAFIMAITLESVDTRVRGAARVSQILGAPVLASLPVLPRRPWKRPHVLDYLRKRPRSAFAEGCRSLYNACRLFRAGRKARVIMVGSGPPQVGTSTAAIGLAVAAAAAGARTVLVDLDMRTGGLGRMMKLDEDLTPLEEHLYGDRPLSDILHPVPDMPALDIVVPSRSDERAAEMLQAERLERFLNALRSEYDTVIIDAPPLLVVEDAASIAPLVDGFVLIVAWARSTEEELVETGERLRGSGFPLIGAVLNRVDPASRGSDLIPGSRPRRRRLDRYFAS